jgi:hypothetical protein
MSMRFFFWLIGFFLIIAFFTGAAIFVGGLKFVQDEPIDASSAITTTIQNLPLQLTQEQAIEPVKPPKKAATLIEHTFPELGFALSVPEFYSVYNGYCKEENGMFIIEDGDVKAKIFELQDRVVIGPEYYYTFPDPAARNMSKSPCQWIENAAEEAQQNLLSTWTIHSFKAENDIDLVRIIQSLYGADCQLGAKIPTEKQGTWDIEVAGHSMDSNADCMVNYVYAFKFAPDLKRAVTWKLGQGPIFLKANITDAFDADMMKSFRFLP